MASTYVNDLRLEEIGTGEASGTWGTKTNANLELIGEAFSYGSEASSVFNHPNLRHSVRCQCDRTGLTAASAFKIE